MGRTWQSNHRKKRTVIRKGILVIGSFLFVMILCSWTKVMREDSLMEELVCQAKYDIYENILKTYFPVATYEEKTLGSYTLGLVENYLPTLQYTRETSGKELKQESTLDYKDIISKEAADENFIDENGKLVSSVEGAIEENEANKVSINMDKLNDYDYLVQNFYRIDRTTTIGADQLNASTLLGKDMTINNEGDEPKVLIYHTHSQEAYCDSDGTSATSVVAVGEYLTQLLQNTYGIHVLHHTGEYDRESRSTAYSLAGTQVEQILKENPSIQVVIDLHRDGVAEGTRLVSTVNGKETAKIMFFNGLSRTTATGDIPYLYNPYIEDNLALSLQLQVEAAGLYQGYTRAIYLKGYRYNMHLCPKSLLIEVGAQTNTFGEAKNAMEPLAYILWKVLLGK